MSAERKEVQPVQKLEPKSAESSRDEGSMSAKTGVAKSTALISAATLTSRLTGFLRTWACAFALGNTVLTSAYQVANNLPNMLYELVAGGILSTAFLPVLMTQMKKDANSGNSYASNLLNLCILVLGLISLAATVFAPQVIATQTFTNSSGQVADEAVFFFRFFSIQIVFYGAGAIVSGILNANRRFLMPALGPVFNNICVIIAMFSYVPLSASNPELAKTMLAVLTSLGVAVQCLVQIPALKKAGFKWRVRLSLADSAFKETTKLALPAIAFTAMNLVCVSCRNAFALGTSDIGPSTLSYAWLWFQLPYGVLAVSLSTAMYTEMSDSAAEGDMRRYRANVRDGLKGTFFMIIPMAVALIVLAPLLTALYHAGQFTSDDIERVALVLRVWAICLPMYAGYLYLYFAFSARKRLVVVTVVSVLASLVQILGYATLTGGLGSFDALGICGIPVSDIVFFTAMYISLYALLRREVGSFSSGEVLKVAAKTALASCAGGVVMYALMMLLGQATSIMLAFVEVVVIGLCGFAVIFFLCRLLRVEEVGILTRLLSGIKRKLLRR